MMARSSVRSEIGTSRGPKDLGIKPYVFVRILRGMDFRTFSKIWPYLEADEQCECASKVNLFPECENYAYCKIVWEELSNTARHQLHRVYRELFEEQLWGEALALTAEWNNSGEKERLAILTCWGVPIPNKETRKVVSSKWEKIPRLYKLLCALCQRSPRL